MLSSRSCGSKTVASVGPAPQPSPAVLHQDQAGGVSREQHASRDSNIFLTFWVRKKTLMEL